MWPLRKRKAVSITEQEQKVKKGAANPNSREPK
jgi:hypothetical protein